jgi:hypothetical protein
VRISPCSSRVSFGPLCDLIDRGLMGPCTHIVKEVPSELWAHTVISSRDYVLGTWAHVRISPGSSLVSFGHCDLIDRVLMGPCTHIVKEVPGELWAHAVISSRNHVLGTWAHVRISPGSSRVSFGPL